MRVNCKKNSVKQSLAAEQNRAETNGEPDLLKGCSSWLHQLRHTCCTEAHVPGTPRVLMCRVRGVGWRPVCERGVEDSSAHQASLWACRLEKTFQSEIHMIERLPQHA